MPGHGLRFVDEDCSGVEGPECELPVLAAIADEAGIEPADLLEQAAAAGQYGADEEAVRPVVGIEERPRLAVAVGKPGRVVKGARGDDPALAAAQPRRQARRFPASEVDVVAKADGQGVGKPGRPGREPADEVEGRHGVTVEEDQHVAFTDGCTQVARRPGAEPEVRLAHDHG